MTRIIVTLLLGILVSANTYSQSLGLDSYRITRLTGAHGRVNTKENIYKVFQPREDLQISMSGVRVMPAMGLVSWVAFKKENSDTSIQGNLVLTEDQITPIIDIALNNGLRITSLENHYLWESPKVMFMHIEGSGKEVVMAKVVGKLFNEITRTSHGNGNFPLATMDIDKTTLNPHKINSILHTQGILKNGVYKIVFDKKLPKNENEIDLTTWVSFAGTDKEALAVGDIATHQAVLNKVLLALHQAGFYIVAIHPQASKTNPQMVYLHYMGIGNTKTLAKGIHTALSVPAPLIKENNNGLTVYPLILYPGQSSIFPGMTPINNNGNFILNLDISFFNQSKIQQPILENTNQLNNKTTASNTEAHSNVVKEMQTNL